MILIGNRSSQAQQAFDFICNKLVGSEKKRILGLLSVSWKPLAHKCRVLEHSNLHLKPGNARVCETQVKATQG